MDDLTTDRTVSPAEQSNAFDYMEDVLAPWMCYSYCYWCIIWCLTPPTQHYPKQQLHTHTLNNKGHSALDTTSTFFRGGNLGGKLKIYFGLSRPGKVWEFALRLGIVICGWENVKKYIKNW